MPDGNLNGMYSAQNDNRGCCDDGRGRCNNNGGLFGNFGCGCDSEILFFIIIFLLLFTNFGCCCRG